MKVDISKIAVGDLVNVRLAVAGKAQGGDCRVAVVSMGETFWVKDADITGHTPAAIAVGDRVLFRYYEEDTVQAHYRVDAIHGDYAFLVDPISSDGNPATPPFARVTTAAISNLRRIA